MSTFDTKLARFQEGQEKRNNRMAKRIRSATLEKLREIIETTKDPAIVIEAANTLAKFLPKPQSPHRKKGTPVGPIKPKEPTIAEMVEALEKKRKGKELTEAEKQMLAPMEDKRKEVANSGGSAEVD